MRISIRLLAAFALTLGFAACGGDDDGDGGTIDAAIDAAPSIDAAIDAPPATNALGTVCTFANPTCPEGNVCTGIQGVGSTTMGYCSPMCMDMNSICSTGYTGPQGGMPVCALSEAQGAPPTLCAILCTMPAQCGAGLDCIPVPGQNASVCAPPA
jgi:hypothetical protein